MTTAVIIFIVSSLVVVFSAIKLTQFADSFAKATGLGHLVVGSIFLASATSLPECFVDISLILQKMPNLAVGGLVGSNLFNLLILAVADLSHRERGAIFSRRSMESSLPGVVSVGMIALLGIGIVVEKKITAPELFGVGIFPLALFIAYLLSARIVYRDRAYGGQEEDVDDDSEESHSVAQAVIGFLVAAAVIFIAAPYTAESAGVIAEKSGIGQTFFGTTCVAFATSLPELAACISAVRMRAFNLAIGNVVGSNTFNLLLLVPLDVFHQGSLVAALDDVHLLTCFTVVLVTSVVVVGQLYRVESRRFFIEPDAGLVLLLGILGLGAVYYCQ